MRSKLVAALLPNNVLHNTAYAAIFGIAGLALSADERALFSQKSPLGFILFKRNIANPRQVIDLVNELRQVTGRANCPILIDQEGGKVARLAEPHWPYSLPETMALGEAYKEQSYAGLRATQLHGQALAAILASVGVNVNCAPVMDVPVPGAHDVIGTRAFAQTPDVVARLGFALANALLSHGVTPIMKHLPGHGRAVADSHDTLPEVAASLKELMATDFYPFAQLAQSGIGHLVWGMLGHVAYMAIDASQSASVSPRVIQDIIRGSIGFDGFLLPDGLQMNALGGSMAERTRASLDAGCDAVLYCHTDVAEMAEILDEAGLLGSEALRRLAACHLNTPSQQQALCANLPSIDDILAEQKFLLASMAAPVELAITHHYDLHDK